MTRTDYGSIVTALRAVPGVADADLAPDDAGGLGTLRLGLAPGFDEVQVAASVGRLLRERFGLGVDPQCVQLVEDAGEPPAAVPVPNLPPRPSIQRMQIVSSGRDVAATVTLGFGDRLAVGEADGPVTQPGVQRAVALATLRALEELVEGRAKLDLDYVDVVPTGTELTAIASVTLVVSGGSERLTGAAVVRDDPRQAVIRATLDALNRRLTSLLR